MNRAEENRKQTQAQEHLRQREPTAHPGATRCESCNSVLPVGALFCGQCGAAVGGQKKPCPRCGEACLGQYCGLCGCHVEPIRCPGCSAQYHGDFCPHCSRPGSRLAEDFVAFVEGAAQPIIGEMAASEEAALYAELRAAVPDLDRESEKIRQREILLKERVRFQEREERILQFHAGGLGAFQVLQQEELERVRTAVESLKKHNSALMEKLRMAAEERERIVREQDAVLRELERMRHEHERQRAKERAQGRSERDTAQKEQDRLHAQTQQLQHRQAEAERLIYAGVWVSAGITHAGATFRKTLKLDGTGDRVSGIEHHIQAEGEAMYKYEGTISQGTVKLQTTGISNKKLGFWNSLRGIDFVAQTIVGTISRDGATMNAWIRSAEDFEAIYVRQS